MVECLHPVDAWKCGSVLAKDGVRSINLVFSPNQAEEWHRRAYGPAWKMMLDRDYMPQKCGKCAACQIRKRKDMATKLSNEASLYQDAMFVTLTYNDDNLPYTNFRPMLTDKKATLGDPNDVCPNKPIIRGKEVTKWEQELQPTLLPRDITLFLKRLRNFISRHSTGVKVRYFCVGEYGSKTSRPHYHLLIFGWRPDDLKIFQYTKNYYVYRSKIIEEIWPFGFSTIGDVNAGVAKYCARYVTKKMDDVATPRKLPTLTRCPVFFRQSTRNGGMGAPWFDRYASHVMSVGYVTYRSGARITKAKMPQTYLRRCRKYRLPLWLVWRERAIQFHLEAPPVSVTVYEDLLRACLSDEELARTRAESEVF